MHPSRKSRNQTTPSDDDRADDDRARDGLDARRRVVVVACIARGRVVLVLVVVIFGAKSSSRREIDRPARASTRRRARDVDDARVPRGFRARASFGVSRDDDGAVTLVTVSRDGTLAPAPPFDDGAEGVEAGARAVSRAVNAEGGGVDFRESLLAVNVLSNRVGSEIVVGCATAPNARARRRPTRRARGLREGFSRRRVRVSTEKTTEIRRGERFRDGNDAHRTRG